MNTTKEKASYSIGFETARNLLAQFAEIESTKLLEGMQDGLQGTTPKLSIEEISSILTKLRAQVEQQQQQFLTQLAAKNKKEGEEFLQKNQRKEGVFSLPSGLQYTILHKNPNGRKPSLFDNVQVHYTGKFINGTTFDSSIARGEPAIFPVNRVIPGWSEALQLMQEGEKWQIFIPHYLAYGEHGFGREIGPNSTLIFEMELLAVQPK